MSPANDLFNPVNVAGLRVAAIRTSDLIEIVADQCRSCDADRTGGGRRLDSGASEPSRPRSPLLISYANAWSCCLARDHPDYAHILNETAQIVYADGQSVVWASRWLGRPLPERVNAGDFWPDLLSRLAVRGASVYLLGGVPGLAEATAHALTRLVPDLKIAGTHHGYFADNSSEEAAVAAAIRVAAPSVVFVGMGAPRQERWAARHLDDLGASVLWCVGALFEYFGGRRSRAPVWMRRFGLEWLYRLALEPARLWRRYLIGNLRFLGLVLRQRRGSIQ